MTSDLLLATISLAGLLGYATVGVAVAHIAEPKLKRACIERYGVDHGRCGDGHDHESHHKKVAETIGAFWVVVCLAVGAWRVDAFVSRGPNAWGTALANLLTSRAERRAALVRQVAERDQRIAELEREVLG